ncbi:MAG TPA: hypothetical protein VGR37_22080 [Longimicrobiaceae bacterium]|nr:hypothetical protein [Longimicrobiaceae bacterium]
MYTLLRWIVEWKARRRGAQVIVFDGGSEVERSRAFFQGLCVGGGAVLLVGILTAPALSDPGLRAEAERRGVLLAEASRRTEEAVSITAACLQTAQTMRETLEGYREIVERYPGVVRGR